jgi:hypothetical protein
MIIGDSSGFQDFRPAADGGIGPGDDLQIRGEFTPSGAQQAHFAARLY